MFSISHPSGQTFRLEIHGSPSELTPAEGDRLRAVLLALAREIQVSSEEGALPEEEAPDRRTSPSEKEEAPAP